MNYCVSVRDARFGYMVDTGGLVIDVRAYECACVSVCLSVCLLYVCVWYLWRRIEMKNITASIQTTYDIEHPHPLPPTPYG